MSPSLGLFLIVAPSALGLHLMIREDCMYMSNASSALSEPMLPQTLCKNVQVVPLDRQGLALVLRYVSKTHLDYAVAAIGAQPSALKFQRVSHAGVLGECAYDARRFVAFADAGMLYVSARCAGDWALTRHLLLPAEASVHSPRGPFLRIRAPLPGLAALPSRAGRLDTLLVSFQPESRLFHVYELHAARRPPLQHRRNLSLDHFYGYLPPLPTTQPHVVFVFGTRFSFHSFAGLAPDGSFELSDIPDCPSQELDKMAFVGCFPDSSAGWNTEFSWKTDVALGEMDKFPCAVSSLNQNFCIKLSQRSLLVTMMILLLLESSIVLGAIGGFGFLLLRRQRQHAAMLSDSTTKTGKTDPTPTKNKPKAKGQKG